MPISHQAAVRLMLDKIVPLSAEPVEPRLGMGRVCAEDLASACNVPEHPCSVRDGYAMRSAEVGRATPAAPVRLVVSQFLQADSTSPAPLEPGTTARVLTGGPIPPGGDAVMAEEDVREIHTDSQEAIEVSTPVDQGWYVRPVGGEISRAAVVARKGTRLGPQAAAVLTRTRRATVPLHPRPRVITMALGSELAHPDRPMGDDTHFPADNLVLVRGLFESAGAEVVEADVIPDKENRLVDFLSRGDLPELVTTSGGTGNSERDFARSAAEQAGFKSLFHRVDIRPGRNVFAAMRGTTLLIGLPGPPAAVNACFHALILPVVRALSGLDPHPGLTARLDSELKIKTGPQWLVQCCLSIRDGVLTATPLAGKSTPPMLGLGRSHGVALPEGGRTLHPGDPVRVLTTLF